MREIRQEMAPILLREESECIAVSSTMEEGENEVVGKVKCTYQILNHRGRIEREGATHNPPPSWRQPRQNKVILLKEIYITLL